MQEMDEFVLNYTLERLDKDITNNQAGLLVYQKKTDDALLVVNDQLELLETDRSSMDGSINTLKTLVEALTVELQITRNELNKTKMINVKQEIIIRTLHNLQQFDAYDMHVDTFTDSTNIDWDSSVRGEWMEDIKAVGKTDKSTVKLQQLSVPNVTLISANGSDDAAIEQSFHIDKDQAIGKVSLILHKHDPNTWQPIKISIRSVKGGTIISQVDVPVARATGDWIDIELPRVQLNQYVDYYIDIRTSDIYGYRIGADTLVDRYLAGTSYNFFNGVWTDNNFDIGFKVWCFPASDENDATLITKKKTLDTLPTSIVFDREEVAIGGTINYHVSRNDGVDWKLLQPGIETSLNDLPEGKELRIKAYMTGDSRIDAWGYVVKRSETI